jgi:AbrB family looped-hinge helix DNA binding protein
MKMSVTVEKTRLSRGNQVVVPAKLRKRFGLKEGDEVVWALLGEEVHVKFVRKRRNALTDLIGKLDMGRTNPDLIDEIVSSG